MSGESRSRESWVVQAPARAKRETAMDSYSISEVQHSGVGAFWLVGIRSDGVYLSLCRKFAYCQQSNPKAKIMFASRVILLTDFFFRSRGWPPHYSRLAALPLIDHALSLFAFVPRNFIAKERLQTRGLPSTRCSPVSLESLVTSYVHNSEPIKTAL